MFTATPFDDNKLHLSFPFECKEQFKELFKTARWMPEERKWEVADTTANKNKFERFTQMMQGVARVESVMESAENDAKELERLQASLNKRIAAARARTEAARAKIALLAPVVAAKRAELKTALAEAKAAEAKAAK